MMQAEAEGWGKKLSWSNLTRQSFQETVNEILNNPRARDTANKIGSLMRDRPFPPSIEVGWWAGYLMRTGGAPHLRSPALDLYWHQLYNLDVWLFVVCVLSSLLWLLIYAFRRCCCGGKKDAAGATAGGAKLKKN